MSCLIFAETIFRALKHHVFGKMRKTRFAGFLNDDCTIPADHGSNFYNPVGISNFSSCTGPETSLQAARPKVSKSGIS